MEGFDSMTMAYLNTPMPLGGTPALQTPDLIMPLDALSNYDNETFVGSEDASQYGLSYQPPLTPSIKRFSSTYEDGFSDHLSQYDQHMQQESTAGEMSSIDRDHQLLSFAPTTLNCNVLDFAFRQISVNLAAQLHGMFFLAESPWPSAPNDATPLTELTCYRRNLFQVTGSVTLSRALRYIVTEQGEQLPISSQELIISATESTEQNAVKIISVPWKTPATSAPVPSEEKTEKEPMTVALDLSTAQEIDGDYVNLPFAWKRLQFRIATANNGRRKELQQHFVVHLRVVATLENGRQHTICETHSGPIIVRGRSPRNFQSRNDLPIGTSTGGGRRSLHLHHANGSNTSLHSQPAKTHTGDGVSIKLEPPRSAPLEMPSMPMPSPYEASMDMSQISPSFFDWQMPVANLGAIGVTQAPQNFGIGPLDGAPLPNAMYAQSSPDLSGTAMFNMHHATGGRPQHARHRSQQYATFQANQFGSTQLQAVPLPRGTGSRAPISLSLTDDMSDLQPAAAAAAAASAPPRTSTSPFAADSSQPPPRKVARLSTTPTLPHAYLSPTQSSATPNLNNTNPNTNKTNPNTTTTTKPTPVSQPHGSPQTSPPLNPNFTVPLSATAFDADSADQLYEYFPLGLEDWSPPVDAVYRPHVVHHSNLPADPKSIGSFSSGFAIGGGHGMPGFPGLPRAGIGASSGAGAGAGIGIGVGIGIGPRRSSKRYHSDEGISI